MDIDLRIRNHFLDSIETKRNALEEYTNEHIRNSIFFDIDRFSKKNTDIPHMLPVEVNGWLSGSRF